MQHWLNQYSFLLAGGAAMLLLAAVLLRDGVRPADLVALGALGVGLAFAYTLLRPGESTESQAASVRRLLGAGRPVLLEFQSPY